MAFDSVVMSAIVAELRDQLTGGRISKIYQPQIDELVLLIYSSGRNYRLIVSANARFARLHLTGVEKTNPSAPPTFCMLMRKYLDGGRILAIRQVGRERICRVHVGVTDELGNPAEFILVAEVMGKHSNLVLVNPQGRIVDAIRRVTEEVNRYRELLPGLLYVAPPPMTKLDPAGLHPLSLQVTGDEPAWRALLDQVDGLGPLLAKEAVARAGYPVTASVREVDRARLASAAREVTDPSAISPALLFDPSGPLKDFHAISLRHWEGKVQSGFESINACADAYFGRKEQEDRLSALRGSLSKVVRDAAGRAKRKVQLQIDSQRTAENAESYRIQGELLTAHLWQVQKGDVEAIVTNYYDADGGEVVIALDPALTPAENAQAIYHRYQKARSGLAQIQEQLRLSRDELAYLEQVEATLQESTTLPDLEEVRRELQDEGYLSDQRNRKGERTNDKRFMKSNARARRPDGAKPGGDAAQRVAPPLIIISSDGLEIWVGRNNRQNDTLTMKLAAPHDLWFHTKEIPGSHVILRVPPGQEIPELAIHEAAALAAWHSKGRDSASVPVDYTLRKHVRKPSGSKPGMVIYDNQKTLWVTPDPELIPILRRHVEGIDNGTGTVAGPDRERD